MCPFTCIFVYIYYIDLKSRTEEELTKKTKESDKETTPLKYDNRMDTQTSALADKSSHLLSSSYDTKTPPTQSSPHGGTNRNPSPITNAQHKAMEVMPSSIGDENPTSVPPPSVFPAPSPRDQMNVASPQLPSVSATLTSASPPSSVSGPVTAARIASQIPAQPHTARVSMNGSIPVQAASVPSSTVHQNMQQPPTRSFTQTVNQPTGNTSLVASQPTHMGSVVNHPPNPNQLNQGSNNLTQAMNRIATSSATMAPHSLPQNIQIPSSMSKGFPNVVATCTSLPSTTTTPLYSQIGALPPVSIQATVPTPNPPRQPIGSMAAAVAAAEEAVMQANAQILPSQRMVPSGINMPGQPVSAGTAQIMPSSVVTSQPIMNMGISDLVGSAPQTATTVTPSMIASSQAAVQPNVPATQPGMQQQPTGMPGQQQQQRPPVQLTGVQPGVSSGQPVIPSQFGGMHSSQPARVMPQAPAPSQAPSGMPQPTVGPGQQQLLPANPGMKPLHPSTGMQQQPPQSQPIQPGIVGAPTVASSVQNTLQMSGQQQPSHLVAQTVMSTGQQLPNQQVQHPGQPATLVGQIPQQVRHTFCMPDDVYILIEMLFFTIVYIMFHRYAFDLCQCLNL